jgi:carbonic anhydrase
MRSFTLLAVVGGGIATCLLLGGCTVGDSTPADSPAPNPAAAAATTPPLNGTDVPFGYRGATGPSHWADLSEDYAVCGTGTSQSPVALTTTASDASRGEDTSHGEGTGHGAGDGGSDGLAVDYTTMTPDLPTNNGHSIELEPTGRTHAGITLAGQRYDLAQFHFHSPAEHTIDGHRADIEFHFVHKNAAGDTVVLSVMADEGASNAAWQPFVDAASTPRDDEMHGAIDLAALLPSSLDHLSYEGSLTTPPCTEGVRWLVTTTPINLGADQVAALDRAYIDNARPLQDLHGRSVTAERTAG